MKLKFEKSELLNGLQIAERAIPKHTMQPILECVVIDATKDKVKLNTYDGDMSICCTVEGDIQQEGMSAIDAKILVPIIKKMPDGEVTITVKDDTTATIKGGRVKFDVPCRSADDFPALPMVDIFSNTVTMSQYTLKEAIRTTIFSCGDVASTNKAMSGELFELNGDRLTIVSLDGHRIAIRNSDLRKSYDPAKVIIPGKALSEIMKILSGNVEEDVTIALEDKYATFIFGNTVIVTRLIEAKYFDLRPMLNIAFSTKITVNRRAFLDCVDRATLLVKEGDKKPFILETGDGVLDVRLASVLGKFDDQLDAIVTGQPIKIGFNPLFVVDALRAIDDEEIVINLSSPRTPCSIQDDEQSYNYIILPVALKE